MFQTSRRSSSRRLSRLTIELLETRETPTAGIFDSSFGVGGVSPLSIDFGPAGERIDSAQAIVAQSDGKVVVAGSVQRGANTSDFGVARFNRDGSPDISFGGTGFVVIPFDLGGGNDDQAHAIGILRNGKIVVAGFAETPGSGRDFAICRLNANGSLDPTFSGDGKLTLGFDLAGSLNDTVADLLVYPNGKMLLAGTAATATGADFAVCRLHANGLLDRTFSGDGKVTFGFDGAPNHVAEGAAFAQRGKIVVAGTATIDANNSHVAVAQLTAAGVLDSSFDVDGRLTFDYNATVGNHTGRDVAVQPDGRIVIVGEAENANVDLGIARLLPTGAFDDSFDNDGKRVLGVSNDGDRNDSVAGVLVQPDGKIVIAGTGPRAADTDFFGMRLNSNGTADTSYNSSGLRFYDLAPSGVSNDRAAAVALTADGFYIAGDQEIAAGNLDFAVVRIERDDWVVVSADRGGPPTVKVFTPTGTELFRFNAATPSFRGGIRVAAGDITGDGVPELFTVPSVGAAAVTIWNGFSLQAIRTIPVFPGFRGGVNIVLGDVLGDSTLELLVASVGGRAPDVLFIDPRTGSLLKTLRVFDDDFRGAVQLAVGNSVVGTPKEELVIGTGPNTAPVVRIFNGETDTLVKEIAIDPTGLAKGFHLGVSDVLNRGLEDVVITPGAGGPPVIRVINVTTDAQVQEYTAFATPVPGGLRLAVEELSSGGPDEIIVGTGPGTIATVKLFNGSTGAELIAFRPFGALRTGLFVLGVVR